MYANIIYVRENCFFVLLLFRSNRRGGYLNSSYGGADVSNEPLNEHRDRLTARLHRMSDFFILSFIFGICCVHSVIKWSFDSLGSQWWSPSRSEPAPKLERLFCILRIWIRMNENDKCEALTIQNEHQNNKFVTEASENQLEKWKRNQSARLFWRRRRRRLYCELNNRHKNEISIRVLRSCARQMKMKVSSRMRAHHQPPTA